MESVEIVRRVYDGWIDGDVASALESLHPDVVWEAIADAPDAGVYRGHPGVRRYMEDWLADFDFVAMDFEEVTGNADDGLVIVQRGHAIGKGSGVETQLHYAVAYRFSEGKIGDIREFRSKAEACAAIGLAAQGRRPGAPKRLP